MYGWAGGKCECLPGFGGSKCQLKKREINFITENRGKLGKVEENMTQWQIDVVFCKTRCKRIRNGWIIKIPSFLSANTCFVFELNESINHFNKYTFVYKKKKAWNLNKFTCLQKDTLTRYDF